MFQKSFKQSLTPSNRSKKWLQPSIALPVQAHRWQILSSLGFLFRTSLKGFKMCLRRRDFHTLVKNVSFSSSTVVKFHNPTSSGPSVLANTRSPLCSPLQPCGISQSTPFGAQCPRWHSFPSSTMRNKCQRGRWTLKGVDCEISHRLRGE